jgi:hypothetical protein
MDKETRERRRVVMECVEGMLGANPELRRIAQLALADGAEVAEVKDALARAFLACYWYAAQEGCGGGEPVRDIADRFKRELNRP